MKALMRFFSKKELSVKTDIRDFPKPNSTSGIQIIKDLVDLRDRDRAENLYQQSVRHWRTDWQCALCEVQCKLNPDDNQKLLLWLSAYILDGRKEDAGKLRAFIRQLPLTAEDQPLWRDVNVHYSLLNDDIRTAKALVLELQKNSPGYPIVWPQIAIMQYHSKHDEDDRASEIAQEILNSADTPTTALPLLLETLLSNKKLEFVSEFCLRHAQDMTDVNPEVINIGARSMFQSGRADLSLRFLQDHADVVRQVPHAWFTLRECVLKLDRYADVGPELEETFGNEVDDSALFRRALLQVDLNDLEGANDTLSEFADNQSEQAAQLRVLIASQQPQMAGAAEAYGAFLDLPYPRATAAMIYAGNLLGQARQATDLEDANQVLKTTEEAAQKNSDFASLQIHALVALGKWDEAKLIWDQTQSILKRRARDRFDQYFCMREGRGKNAHQISHIASAAVRNRSVHNASALPVAKTFSYDPKRDKVLCFCCVYNGIEFVEWFLDYYRQLGIDHFFFVDNASNDGTTEHLAAQQDVSLFIAEGSFKDSAHGVYWINDLMKSYAVGKWAFFVDMDEAFVFPMMDQGRTLNDLLAFFDEQGFECSPSLMVDMFSDQGGNSSFAENCYYDNSYLTYPTERAPYLTTQGGFRTRMTGRNILITKSPLVKVNASFSYLENNHFHTHLAPSDLTTCVLHYKFVGALSERIEEALQRKEHFLGAVFYKDLKRAIQRWAEKSDDPFSQGPDTLRYGSAGDLVEAGVIRSSPAWQDFDAGNALVAQPLK